MPSPNGALPRSDSPSDQWPSCPHSAAQECQAVEGRYRGRRRAQRGPAGVEIPRTRPLATMERLPTPKPRRDEDAPREPKVREAKLSGQRLLARDFDRQVAGFQVRVIRGLSRTSGVRPLIPERQHRTLHPCHKGRGIGPSGRRRSPAVSRLVKQSPLPAISPHQTRPSRAPLPAPTHLPSQCVTIR